MLRFLYSVHKQKKILFPLVFILAAGRLFYVVDVYSLQELRQEYGYDEELGRNDEINHTRPEVGYTYMC